MQLIDIFKYGLDHGQFPRYLYKYRTIDQTKQIISNPALFFPSYDRLNDPFECFAHIECNVNENDVYKFLLLQGIPDRLANIKAREMVGNIDLLDKIVKDAIQYVMENIGILSLSSSPIIPSMFNNYSNAYTGSCIEFDLTKELDTFYFPKEVQYSNDMPRFDYIKAIVNDNADVTTEALFHKTTDWSYEKEYRVIKMGKANKLISINPECITSIIFGKDASLNDINAVKEIIASQGYNWITCKQAQVLPTSPSLQLTNI